MKISRQRFLSACLPLLACCTTPYASAAPEDGMWSGLLGNNPVIACFQAAQRADVASATNASYYFYLRHGKPIALRKGPDGLWYEGDVQQASGVWNLAAQAGGPDQLSGQWSDPAKTRSLSLRLNRFNTLLSHEAPGCHLLHNQFDPASMAQVMAEKLSSGARKSFMGRNYQELAALDGALTSFQLQDGAKAATALNSRLQNQLRVNIASYYGCPTDSERQGGKRKKNEKPEFQASIEPLFWNANWLSVVERSAGDCGGAHPFSGFSYSTWNLNSGEVVNPWQWIKNGRKADTPAADANHYFSYAAPEALNKIIVKQAIKQRLTAFPNEAREANGCVDVIKENKEYQISLGKNGLIFTPNFPHVVQACTEDSEVSYAEMMPFLNPAGRAALQALRQK